MQKSDAAELAGRFSFRGLCECWGVCVTDFSTECYSAAQVCDSGRVKVPVEVVGRSVMEADGVAMLWRLNTRADPLRANRTDSSIASMGSGRAGIHGRPVVDRSWGSESLPNLISNNQ